MNRDEETIFLRQMQEADAELFQNHFNLISVETTKDNNILCHFDVSYQKDSGYLKLKCDLNKHLLAAEMNVNFLTPIGLNRSPLELKILAEHALEIFSDEIKITL